MMSSADQLEQFLDLALDSLLEIMGAETGWLQLVAPGCEQPLASVCRGCTDEMKRGAEALALREAGRPAEAGAIIVPDLARAGDPDLAPFAAAGYASLMAVPLSTSLFNGILGYVSREPAAFNGESAEVLKLKASLIGAALEKMARSRGLADVLARQHQRYGVKKFKRLAVIAGGRCQEIRQAMRKAFGRARRSDKQYARATINLARETARWEDVLKQYKEQFARINEPTGPETGPSPAVPAPAGPSQAEAAPEAAGEAAGAAKAPAGEEVPPAEAPVAGAPGTHADRMQAFRRSHAGFK
jgi:hypothetical protein